MQVLFVVRASEWRIFAARKSFATNVVSIAGLSGWQ